MNATRFTLALTCASAFLAGCGGSSPGVVSPAGLRYTATAGAFYANYTGPQRPAIDAIAADGSLNAASQTITLVAKMAGPIAAGAPNYYVWGFDRGGASTGTAPFPGEPNVKFNAVAVVTVDATGAASGTINLLAGSPAQPIPSVLIVAPDTIQLQFPASMLPSTGFTPAQYTWNLWPRSGVGGSATAQIASFIPENAMATLLSI